MTETKREEHDRLQHRTEELRQDTADLSLEQTPFNEADHVRHRRNLADHKADLVAHRLRTDDGI
jgi:hypothetical protein